MLVGETMDDRKRRTEKLSPVAAAMRSAVRLLRERSGAVTMITVLMLPILAGFGGLAVDVGFWYVQFGKLRSVADVAAVTAAMELNSGSTTATARAQAIADAARNGIGSSQITVNMPPTSGAFTADNNAAEVVITETLSLFFTSIFRLTAPAVTVRAVAAQRPGPPIPQNACIVALDPSVPNALRTASNATITANGCAIQVNSTSSAAVNLQATPTDGGGNPIPSVTAPNVCITGNSTGPRGNANYSTPPMTGSTDCPVIADPLASLTAPTVGACDCDSLKISDDVVTNTCSKVIVATTATVNPNPAASGATVKLVTLTEGVYCNGIKLESNANVVFSAGVYIVKSDRLFFDSNVNVDATAGVGFYLTGDASDGYARVSFKSNAVVDIVAPSSGDLEGLVFFEDRNAPAGQWHDIDSNAVVDFEGSLYFSQGTVVIDSNGTVSGNSPYTQIIARKLSFDSNSRLTLNNRVCSVDPTPPCTNVPTVSSASISVPGDPRVALTE